MNALDLTSPQQAPMNNTSIGHVAAKMLLTAACILLVGTVSYSIVTGRTPMNWCFYSGMILLLIHRIPMMIERARHRREEQQHASEIP
ncbi:hypothetical protein [Schaalia odontolytica]|uniref:Uncharacterized protein n=1 Tax=Schaalia odontolytica TaxID=1660 RepID=A0A857A979_9ACTO|nr:hypothetical protein [Schaalia odontolytica]QGS11434.1 hypothetical protein FOC40_08485 [Schaalia odontolytica]